MSAAEQSAMITREQITGLVRECMSLQTVNAAVDYGTLISIDSFSFLWLQHTLGLRFDLVLEAPENDVLDGLDSPRAVHRYLAAMNPTRVEPVD